MERYRLHLVREPIGEPYGIQFHGPQDVAGVLASVYHDEAVEVLLALHLDRRNRLRGMTEISRGGVHAAPCDLKVLFGAHLTTLQPGLMIAHNHPSGDPLPGVEDVGLTKRVAKAARLLDVEFLDHIVWAHEGWTSLAAMTVKQQEELS